MKTIKKQPENYKFVIPLEQKFPLFKNVDSIYFFFCSRHTDFQLSKSEIIKVSHKNHLNEIQCAKVFGRPQVRFVWHRNSAQ